MFVIEVASQREIIHSVPSLSGLVASWQVGPSLIREPVD